MKVFPRSYWTSIIPRPTTVGDQIVGLPYFDEPPANTDFVPINEDILYVSRNPAEELHRFLKQSTNRTGLSDIDYNYAISQNTRGVYVLRGSLTKCQRTENYRVLMLIGNSEEPTDTLKANQEDFLSHSYTNPYPSNSMSLGDSSVHVFDLIEYLGSQGFYKARNDGIFSEMVAHAVDRLRAELNMKVYNGNFDALLYSRLLAANRDYIKITV